MSAAWPSALTHRQFVLSCGSEAPQGCIAPLILLLNVSLQNTVAASDAFKTTCHEKSMVLTRVPSFCGRLMN